MAGSHCTCPYHTDHNLCNVMCLCVGISSDAEFTEEYDPDDDDSFCDETKSRAPVHPYLR